jgi:hypothetical protein
MAFGSGTFVLGESTTVTVRLGEHRGGRDKRRKKREARAPLCVTDCSCRHTSPFAVVGFCAQSGRLLNA